MFKLLPCTPINLEDGYNLCRPQLLSPESYASEHQHYDEDSSNEAASGSYATNFSASQGTAARRIGTNVSPREGILSPFPYESG